MRVPMKTWQRLLCAGTVFSAVAASHCDSPKFSGNADLGGGGKNDLATGGGGNPDLAGGGGNPDFATANNPDLAMPSLALTMVSPALGPSTGGTLLTLTGTGFASGVTVAIGGFAAAITQITPTQLMVTLPAAPLTKGQVPVIVRKQDGTMVNRADLFAYYYGTVKFSTAVAIPVGSNPYSVAIGDLNNNNKQDLVVANYFDNTVGVLLGNGDGTFGAMGTQTSGLRPRGVALADFNKDGYLDAVAVNYSSQSISVFLNDKTGVLGPRTDTATASMTGLTTNPVAIDAKVATNSTYPDVVTANSASDDASVFLSKAGGGLNSAQSRVASRAPSAVTLADVNADTYLDLVIANQINGSCTVYLGDGKGGFTFKGTYSAGLMPAAVAATDFSGDGKVDLLVSLAMDNRVALLTGNGDGTFNMPVSYSAGMQPAGLALGDFNGDNRPDIATALNVDGTVAVLLNVNGVPGAPMVLAAGSGPQGIAVGDLDGDGRPDIAVANSGGSTLSLFLNKSQ